MSLVVNWGAAMIFDPTITLRTPVSSTKSSYSLSRSYLMLNLKVSIVTHPEALFTPILTAFKKLEHVFDVLVGKTRMTNQVQQKV